MINSNFSKYGHSNEVIDYNSKATIKKFLPFLLIIIGKMLN
jgi:hypothetical protein